MLVRANRNEKRKRKLRERASLERREEELEDLHYLAVAAYRERRFAASRTYCQRLLETDPEDSLGLKLLMVMAGEEDDHHAAIRYAEKLGWKEDAALAVFLATQHALVGNPGRAAEVLDRVLSKGLVRGSGYRRGDLEERLAYLRIEAREGGTGPAGARAPVQPAFKRGRFPPGPGRELRPPPPGGEAAPPVEEPSREGAIALPPIRVQLEFEPPDLARPFTAGLEGRRWARLRRELHSIELLQGYDELLCLSTLRGVDRYWFQVETAKRVLRQFHGRVLLADEVGLGKTIEAGMVIKEYLLRGLVKRVLILTPPNLVEQWREEMANKFDLSFAEAGSRRLDPAFWREEPLIVCSINTAKSEKVSEVLLDQAYDLVVVDEAHHLRNRATRNWQLVNALKRRFLVLISATPVQNHLVELFNLLTLLRPGLLRTEAEFRRKYLSPRNPRLPRNRDELRELMAEVMIRNTRALVDVKLPRRHATTVAVDPDPEEAEVYARLTELLRANPGGAIHRWDAARLLALAGSTPFALEEPLAALRTRVGAPMEGVLEALGRVRSSAKVRKAIDLLRARPGKKILFAHSLRSLELISLGLEEAGIPHALFHGSLPPREKDQAIERFRGEVDLLLSSESGGEGRNLQFCAAMVNFDLPWNPMRIEQRIGRIHRIGQEREVFILNLCARGTVEEKVLKLLHEKINMFELVVGEIDGIVGRLAEDREFSEVILDLWLHPAGAAGVEEGFAALGESLAAAREEYAHTLLIDRELFGEDFQV